MVADAAIQRLLRGFLHDHRNARVGVVHGDAAAHGSRADHRRAPDLVIPAFPSECPGSCSPCARRRTRGSALWTGVEYRHSLKSLASSCAAFFEWKLGGRLHCVDRSQRRRLPAPGLSRRVSRGGKDAPNPRSASFSLRSRVLGAGRSATSRANATAPVSKSPSMIRSTMPSARASCAGDRLAERAHLNRFRNARQARKPLRTSRAGNDSQLHFGLSHLRRRRDHAVMAGHRYFQAAAQGLAVNRHHHGLGRIFNRQQHRQERQARLLAGRHLLELADVGAGNER